MENKFLEKLQDEINIADNRSKMQGDNEAEKARFEGKRDGLIMVRDELKKIIGFNLPVIGSVSSSTTVMKEGYYSDNFNTYYIDKDGKKHLR